MNRIPFILTIASVVGGLVLSVFAAGFLAVAMERRSIEAVEAGLNQSGMDWVEVSANGLQVFLDGTAPSEAANFRAFSRAGSVIDADRIVNRMEVARQDTAAPPRFSVDMLRNSDGIQVIGLVPLETRDSAITLTLSDMADGIEVANLVEMVDFPAPDNWENALAYGLRALRELPRSKVTVYSDRVEVQAVSESVAQRADFIAALQSNQPRGVQVVLDISAPRPVITPFTFRFVIDTEGARFETCAADTLAARNQIVQAAEAAGATNLQTCSIGLGVPSPQWGSAIATAIAAVAELGTGTAAFSDADVTLIAMEGTDPNEFDRVIGELAAALPDVFSLQGVLPEPTQDQAANSGPVRFQATLSDSGRVRLRGRVPEGPIGRSVEAYARALFGGGNTDVATRAVTDLPQGWSLRVMAGLQALSTLNDGTLTVDRDLLLLQGNTGNPDAISDLTRLLGEELGQAAAFELNVTYVEALDPIASLPTPEECVARIQAVQDETKIVFDPGSIEITDEAGDILDQIAQILPDCRHVRMEIAGHTDSQGREEMNLNLSQARAESVLNGLLARSVLVSNLTAQGYGETQPITSNETEEGRESNRRIEFRLFSTATEGEEMDDTDQDLPEGEDGEQQAPSAESRPVPRPDSIAEAAAAARDG